MALVLPALVAMFAWWFTTGIILYLDRLPPRTFRWSMGGATLLLATGFWLVAESSGERTTASAYAGFFGSLAIWVWLEMSFLMGFVTGPRRTAPPPGSTGWRRFRNAVQAILWHELAALSAGLGVLALTWHAQNQVALWTFGAIWTMKLSAKLNIHLGARNLGEHLLPEHLAYLASYFTRRAMNPLLPISIGAASIAVIVFLSRAQAPEASAFEATGCILVATMIGLAMLEHVLLFVPLPPGRFWTLGFGDSPQNNVSALPRGLPSQPLPGRPMPALTCRPTLPLLRLEPSVPAPRRVS